MYFKRIKDLRIDNDLYQKQIANLLKITRQQYGLYESGKRPIEISKALKISRQEHRRLFVQKRENFYRQRQKCNRTKKRC